MKIQAKLGLGFGTQILLAAVLGTSVLLGTFAVKRQFSLVIERNAPTLENARHLLRLVVDMESGQRGFCITHREEFLEPYVAGAKDFDRLIEKEKQLIGKEQGQAERLERIERLVRQWKKEAAEPEIAIAREIAAGRADATRLREVIGRGLGKGILDEIRREFEAFVEVEQRLAFKRYDMASRTAAWTASVAVLLLVLATCVGITVAVLVRRAIARPLVELARGVESVGEGNLDVRIHTDSSDEIGVLARTFNTMGSKLKEEAESRRQAERSQREAELRSRVLLEGSPVCTKIISLDSKLQYMSASGQDMLKITDITPYYGTSYPPEAYPEAAKIVLHEAVEKAKAGEICNIDSLVYDMEGGEVWFNSTFVPARDERGTILYVIGTSVDITARKRTEKALNQKEYYLSKAQEMGSVGTWELDIVNNALVWTEGNYRIFGMPVGAPLSYETFLDAVHPEDRAFVDRQWAKAMNHETYDIEHRLLVDGNVKWVREKAEVTYDTDGKPIKAIGFTQDITDRKEIEGEREGLIAQLEAQNAELERFTYTVSHDLKSPLITIGGYAGMLRNDLANENFGSMASDLSRITGAVDKMGRLLDDVLELSRIGRLVNTSEDVSLETVAHETVAHAGGRLKERGVSIDIAPDLPVVFGDRLRLQEVLQNLIDNAVKYMGDQPQPRIEIGSRHDGEETIFYVRDNGIGIDPRYHEKVFGLFDQLDQSVEGSGIGLSLVRRIVEVHGGRIWVESDGPGQGSTFCFTLAAEGDLAVPDGELCTGGRPAW